MDISPRTLWPWTSTGLRRLDLSASELRRLFPDAPQSVLDRAARRGVVAAAAR
ncbi:hypothetical protein GGQ97_001247 [Sphingomonas kaistensis]|uniref:Uncharacterized protein n=1 Tax=Sphingomonas kaistensis TaxID=298708 RepID=A0A7X6BFJ3_9SPHN|nr:hypothetical protein [Sphingomonas kaistensis]NJC05454.1 hypothetical protein [Sphingomonas kaistensis]